MLPYRLARALQQELLLAPDLEASLIEGHLLQKSVASFPQELVHGAHRRAFLLVYSEVAQIIVDVDARRRMIEKLLLICRMIGRLFHEPVFQMERGFLPVRARALQRFDAPRFQQAHDEAMLLRIGSRRPFSEQLFQRHSLQSRHLLCAPTSKNLCFHYSMKPAHEKDCRT